MHGSGGGYFKERQEPRELARRLRDSEAQTLNVRYETEVNQLLGDFLKEFNNRDVQGTRVILDEVEEALGDEIGDSVNLIFGGSVSRHTYLEGLSDTDALVILDPADIGRETPDQVKDRFAKRLIELFGEENVTVGDLAVTVTVREKKVQLLPAVREGEQFRIAAPNGRSWSRINPRAFAEKLTQANLTQDGNLVPAIKVAKAIIAKLPKQQQLTGYHVESLAIEAFKSYDGQRTYKAMVTHLFESAVKLVNAPIVDRTGQSIYVDEHLGKPASAARQRVSRALQRLYRRLVNADASKSVETWSESVGSE